MGAILQGELEAEAEEGDTLVLLLAAPLPGLGAQAGRAVVEDDGRLDLVAVLPAGPAAAGAPRVALSEQAIRRPRGGVG